MIEPRFILPYFIHSHARRKKGLKECEKLMQINNEVMKWNQCKQHTHTNTLTPAHTILGSHFLCDHRIQFLKLNTRVCVCQEICCFALSFFRFFWKKWNESTLIWWVKTMQKKNTNQITSTKRMQSEWIEKEMWDVGVDFTNIAGRHSTFFS